MNKTQIFIFIFILFSQGQVMARVKKEINPFNVLNRHYLISINKTELNKNLKEKEFCQKIAKGMTSILGARPYYTCSINTKKSKMSSILTKQEKHRDKTLPKFKYHINLKQTKKDLFILTVENTLKRSQEIDFSVIDYKIKYEESKNKELLQTVLKLIKRPLYYDINNKSQKTKLTLAAIAIDKNAELLSSGMIKIKDSGTQINIKRYYESMKYDPEKKEYLMAGLQIAAVFTAATVDYYVSGENVVDWDFDIDQIFSSERLRFDNNARSINWGHAFAGAVYYETIRAHGFSRLESLLGTFTVSALWEFGSEFQEVLSIGDQILTGWAGPIIAETGIHAYKMLNSNHGKNKWVSHILGMIVNPIGHANNLRRGTTKTHILDAREVTKIRFFSSLGTVNGDVKSSLGLDMEYIDLPINGEGKTSGVAWDTVLSDIHIKGTLGKKGLEEVHFITKAVLAAYFKKEVTLDQNQKLNGYSYLVGISSGAEYRSRDYNKREDWMATVNVIGTTLDVTYFFSGVKIRASLDIFADFVLAKTYALEKYNESNGDFSGVITDVMKNEGYQYGVGTTQNARLSLEKNGFEVGVKLTHHYVKGINGRSRYYDQVTNKISNKEKYFGVKVYTSYAPRSFKSFRFGIELEAVKRSGSLFSKLDNFFAEDEDIDLSAMFKVEYEYF